MNKCMFTIPGEPVGKGRARSTVKGWHYTPKKTRDYESLVKSIALEAMNGQPPFDCACRMNVFAYFGIPKSASITKREEMLALYILPTKKPDVDNIIKSIADACNTTVFHDDSQIVDCRIIKLYSTNPRVEVYVERYEVKNG